MVDDGASTSRRLAAILAADIAGYSRLMGEDEAATVRDLKAHQAVVLPLVGRYGGRVIDTAGDGILAVFPSVIDQCDRVRGRDPDHHGDAQRGGARVAPHAVPHWHQPG
jgi:class 3 adenylate cyclase